MRVLSAESFGFHSVERLRNTICILPISYSGCICAVATAAQARIIAPDNITRRIPDLTSMSTPGFPLECDLTLASFGRGECRIRIFTRLFLEFQSAYSRTA